jgi:hypothetical protein
MYFSFPRSGENEKYIQNLVGKLERKKEREKERKEIYADSAWET